MLCTREALKYVIPRRSGNVINIGMVEERDRFADHVHRRLVEPAVQRDRPVLVRLPGTGTLLLM